MTKLQLHGTDNFSSLATDPRFAALMVYLRSQRPKATGREAHHMIQDSGRLEQYLELLDTINDAFNPPTEGRELQKFAPYSNEPLPINTDTNGR